MFPDSHALGGNTDQSQRLITVETVAPVNHIRTSCYASQQIRASCYCQAATPAGRGGCSSCGAWLTRILSTINLRKMAPYDAIAKRNADDERLTFVRKLLDVRDDIVSFVGKSLDWPAPGRYEGLFEGSFNIGVKVTCGDCGDCEGSVMIRFPCPRRTTDRGVKRKLRTR